MRIEIENLKHDTVKKILDLVQKTEDPKTIVKLVITWPGEGGTKVICENKECQKNKEGLCGRREVVIDDHGNCQDQGDDGE